MLVEKHFKARKWEFVIFREVKWHSPDHFFFFNEICTIKPNMLLLTFEMVEERE